MTDKTAQVYVYQERTPQERTDRESYGRVPRKFGAQLVLDSILLTEASFESWGAVISDSDMITEIGQLIGKQIQRRKISNYEILLYQKYNGEDCMREGELSYGVDALAHLKHGFVRGIKNPDFKYHPAG